jgi:hypothetical protein
LFTSGHAHTPRALPPLPIRSPGHQDMTGHLLDTLLFSVDPRLISLLQDTLWAVVFSTSTSTVTLTCGSSSQTFEVGPGVHKLKIPLASGGITVTMIRDGTTVINHTPPDYMFVTNPKTCEHLCPFRASSLLTFR